VGAIRPVWQVLAELAARLGEETGIDSAAGGLAAIAEEVPFYAGLTPEEIGGLGIRWQERDAASNLGSRITGESTQGQWLAASAEAGEPGIQLGTYRDLWAGEVTDRNPALRFLAPEQTLELAPADADRLGLGHGDEADVRSNGTGVRARVAIRERVRPGSAFLIEGTAEANANALTPGERVDVTKAGDGA
jgi:predicted molibdopterin-dependent oxidoreductase YjgC